jgi:AraC-like DNA-binding protein
MEDLETPPIEMPDYEFPSHTLGVCSVSTPCSLHWKDNGIAKTKVVEPRSPFVNSAKQTMGGIRSDGNLLVRVLSIEVPAMENAMPEPFTRPLVELRPIRVGSPDLVLDYLMAAVDAEITMQCPGGSLVLASLGNTIAFYLAQRYGVHGCKLPSDKSGLTRERASRVVEYIDVYLARDLTITELASVACLSPFHFSKMFKRSMGESVHKFVIGRRLMRARSLLQSTSIPLAEIAAITGFTDQSQFTALFKRSMGVTPGKFRTWNGARHTCLNAR